MDKNLEIKVSVIMPVYNCANYVKEAVESILNQNLTDFEFIIIDDASTDGTQNIIKKFKDPRITFIQKPFNSGYTSSLNSGINIAKGVYIARMDGDDMSLPERFTEQVSFLESHADILACGTWFKIIDSDEVIKFPSNPDEIKVALLESNVIGHPTVMLRKKCLIESGLRYTEAMEPAEDYDLWTRLIAYGKIANIPKVLLNYRQHTNQVSIVKRKIQNSNSYLCQRNMLGYIKPEASISDKNMHLRFINSIEILTRYDVEKLAAWAYDLRRANKLINFYNQQLFNQFLNQKKQKVLITFLNRKDRYDWTTLLELVKLKNYVLHTFSKRQMLNLVAKALLFWKISKHVN